MTGLDRLLALPALPRPGAVIGFLGHAASRAADGRHAVDHLLERDEWRIAGLFGPEHGFEGIHAPGEAVASGLHPRWRLPVTSLYGDHRAPTPEDLAGLDLLVVDLQDLGVRCYTYASTLLLTLRACARAGVPALVLDRPTPLAGMVDGPRLDPAFSSFVGLVPLPLVFGLGQGELARTLQARLPGLTGLHLDVLSATGDPEDFQPRPSPAIVDAQAALIYPLTVWCEAIPGVTSEREGERSFQVWGMDGFPAEAFCAEVALEGGRAHPTVCRTADSGTVPGVSFQVESPADWRPVTNALRLLGFLRDRWGPAPLFSAKGARPDFFDKLMGTDRIRLGLQSGASAAELERLTIHSSI